MSGPVSPSANGWIWDAANTRGGLYNSGTERVRVTNTGASVVGTFSTSGALTVDSGGLTVTAGGITVTAGGISITAGYLKLLVTDTDGTVEGQIWYDNSEDKLKFKTAAGVETVTSA